MQISNVPEISLSSIIPLQIIALKDSIRFEINYQDGDGDLGTSEPDSFNLFLTDNRLNIIHKFRIKQLAPLNEKIAIKGKLNFVLNNTVLSDSVMQQNATFNVQVKDRTGNFSNIITTPEILVTKE